MKILKRCPFCGASEAAIQHINYRHFTVTCNACEAEGPPADTAGRAAYSWNVRIPAREETQFDVVDQYDKDGVHIGSGLPKATCPCGLCQKVRAMEALQRMADNECDLGLDYVIDCKGIEGAKEVIKLSGGKAK